MILLRSLAMFYLNRWRAQPGRESLAVVGVAAGVALLFAAQVINSSVTGSFSELAQGVAGKAKLEVVSRDTEGFDQDLYRDVERLAGVKLSAPVVERRVGIVGPGGRRALTLVGADERLPRLGGSLVKSFARESDSLSQLGLYLPQPITDALHVTVGDTVMVQAGERAARVAVARVLTSRDVGRLVQSPIAVTPLGLAQDIVRMPGRITRVVISPSPGKERQVTRDLLRLAHGELDVRPIATEETLLRQTAKPDRQSNQLFSMIGLLVGLLLTYNAMLLTLEERRAFVANLRILGAGDLTIAATFIFDALVVGVAGSLLGVVLGDLLVHYFFQAVPKYLTLAFPVGQQLVIGYKIFLLSILGGVAAALIAAARPALLLFRAGLWQTTFQDLSYTGVVSRAFRSKNVFWAGLALVAATVTVATLFPKSTMVAAVALVVGMIMILPAVVTTVLKSLHAITERLGAAVAQLGIAELVNAPTRAVTLSATGALAVFAILSIGGVAGNLRQGREQLSADLFRHADISVKAGGKDNIYPTELFSSRAVRERAKKSAVVRSVREYRGAFMDWGNRRLFLLAPPLRNVNLLAPNQVIEGDPKLAERRLRKRGWAAVTDSVSSERGLHIGRVFELPTPSGLRRLRLAATISDYGWVGGSIVMNADDFARMWRTSNASELAIYLKPNVPLSEGRLKIRAALSQYRGLIISTAAERRVITDSLLRQALTHVDQTANLVLVASMLAVVAVMLIAISQRHRRLKALMAIGMSPSQLYRVLFIETGAVLLLGCLIGIAFGFLGQDFLDRSLRETAASPAPFVPAWRLALKSTFLAAAFTALAVAIPVRSTVRLSGRRAFSYE